MVFKVRHLANMVRHPGSGISGPNYHFIVRLKSVGQVPFQVGFVVATLRYKQELDYAVIQFEQPGWAAKFYSSLDHGDEVEITRDFVKEIKDDSIIIPIYPLPFGGLIEGTLQTAAEAPIWIRNG